VNTYRGTDTGATWRQRMTFDDDVQVKPFHRVDVAISQSLDPLSQHHLRAPFHRTCLQINQQRTTCNCAFAYDKP